MSILFLVVVWLLTQAAGLFSPPLLDDVDSIHVEAAKEMAMRHDYVTLYVDGIRYLDKPPLPYWLGAIGVHLFGAHDWAIRLALSVSVLVLSLFLYSMGRRWYGERAGFFAACAIATSIGPYIYTRFFIPDVIVGLWMAISADLALRMVQDTDEGRQARPSHVIGFALSCTAAVLSKGLIGIVFPVGMLLIFLFLTGRLKNLFRMRLLLGIVAFLITALPWHILADIQNKASGQSRGWFWFYFINEQVNRYLNTRIPRDYNKVPLVTFYVLLVVWVMPWGIYLAGILRDWLKERKPLREGGPGLMLTIWTILIVGFFTFSTRQEYYTIPAVPALALLAGAYLARKQNGKDVWVRRSTWALFAVGVLVAVVCGYLAIVAKTPQPGVDLFTVLDQHPQDYTLSFGHFFDFTTSAFGYFHAPLIGMSVSMFVTTGLALFFRLRGKGFASVMALTLGMCGVIACIHSGLATFYPIMGSKQLATVIQEHWQPEAKVVLDGEYSNGSSINFYLNQPVYMLNGRVNNLWYGSLYADAPHRFEDDASFLALWQGAPRIFFVTHNKQRTQLWVRQHGGTVLTEYGGKYVVENH
ncbi:MAG: glycosyltransferase family 39 protein [Acidobacteriaceae bacterium]|nr:glycosyltransferase family 39 protein [Acidobacteriaceae bacterium]